MPYIIMAPSDFADRMDQQPTLGCFSTEGKAQYARESWRGGWARLMFPGHTTIGQPRRPS